jgi:16S rRNA (uracil1498-N3)-methyltransferase
MKAAQKKGQKRRRRKKRNPPDMDRIQIDRAVEIDQEIVIEGPPLEALRVQGARPGSIVTLTDGEGDDFRARLLRLTADRASLVVFEAFPEPTETAVEIILLQALPEKERMEWIIQKATELGVSTIVPFKSERAISLEEREGKQKKAHRWQEIAIKAVRQSRRAKVPRVETYRTLREALAFCAGEGLKILLWEKKGESLREVLKEQTPGKIYAMIGPEGGFTREEVEFAREAGFRVVKLGQRILRTETAAITLMGILQYERGDLARG